jgi:hypothetical protein
MCPLCNVIYHSCDKGIVEAVAAIDRQMLQRVWQELDYRIDICCVTKDGDIEHL